MHTHTCTHTCTHTHTHTCTHTHTHTLYCFPISFCPASFPEPAWEWGYSSCPACCTKSHFIDVRSHAPLCSSSWANNIATLQRRSINEHLSYLWYATNISYHVQGEIIRWERTYTNYWYKSCDSHVIICTHEFIYDTNFIYKKSVKSVQQNKNNKINNRPTQVKIQGRGRIVYQTVTISKCGLFWTLVNVSMLVVLLRIIGSA